MTLDVLQVNLEVPSPSVIESAGSVTVLITLDQPFSQDVEFILTPSDNTATGEKASYSPL